MAEGGNGVKPKAAVRRAAGTHDEPAE